MIMYVSMHTTCVNSKDNAKSNDSDHIFAIMENRISIDVILRLLLILVFKQQFVGCLINYICIGDTEL